MDEYIHEYEYSLVPKFDPDEYDPEEDGYFEFLPEDTMYMQWKFFCFCKIWYSLVFVFLSVIKSYCNIHHTLFSIFDSTLHYIVH